jgi:hypothetical protein
MDARLREHVLAGGYAQGIQIGARDGGSAAASA